MEFRDGVMYFLNPNDLEEGAIQEIKNVASLPFIFNHIAIMPDAHRGMGATIGSVIPTKGAIIPTAVGVDIGCGMIAVKTKFNAKHLPDSLEATRLGIERRIPLGAGAKNQKLSTSAEQRYRTLKESKYWRKEDDYGEYSKYWHLQLGSLGSGNHFIEVSLDTNNTIWIVLHSGSRGLGNKLASKHIKIAQQLMDLYHIKLPDRNLAYLVQKTPEFDAYIKDLLFCQEYALANREEMMDRVMTEMSYLFFKENGHQGQIEDERINCHHNFAQLENHYGENVWVTRKGAIQMRENQKGIIPGSMSTSTYIVSGLGNQASFNSAPHGAGRRFSRTEAKRRYNIEDLKTAMSGIECRIDEALIDEIQHAYKDVNKVIKESEPLVRVESTLKQILNVKGN